MCTSGRAILLQPAGSAIAGFFIYYALDGIFLEMHICTVWTVAVAPEFEPELLALPAEVRVELLAQARVLEQFGPTAGRPRVDTLWLKASEYEGTSI